MKALRISDRFWQFYFSINPPGGGGHSLIWPIRGRAAGQGMVFGLSALNRVYNFMRTCPRQGLNLS